MVIVGLSAWGCRSSAVDQLENHWRLEPASLHLPPTVAGSTSLATVTVSNDGRAPLEVHASVSPPFSVDPTSLLVGGGASGRFELSFRPGVEGVHSATLKLQLGDEQAQVPLDATALARPVCALPSPCHTAEVDSTRGVCVDRVLDDGTSCDAACLKGGACKAGECVGAPVDCDDHNRCTADSCAPGSGCRHDDLTASCPASVDPCRRAACDPSVGCGFVDAADGTSCGPNDCTSAHVCLQGLCQARSSPAGSECSAGTLCRAPGRCAGSTCVEAPATALREAWRYEVAGRSVFFEDTADLAGNVYAIEHGPSQSTAPSALVSLDRAGQLRYRVELPELPCPACGGRLMLDPAAHRLYLAQWGRVEARHLDDGALEWSRDTSAGRALRSPQPDGGGTFSSQQLTRLGGLVVEVLLEGYELHKQYAVAMDPVNGQVVWEREWWGHLYGEGVSGAEQLWSTHGDCWGPVVGSDLVGATGANAGVRSDPRHAVAFVGERTLAFGYAEGFVWSTPHGDGVPFTLPGNSSYPGAVADEEGATLALGQVLVHLDSDGGTRWRAVLRGLPTAEVLHPDGGVLVSFTTNDGGASLAHFDRAGSLVFDCPFSAQISDGVATDGQWVTVVGPALVAYEVPGAGARASGFSTWRGSPFNDRRAR